MKNTYQLSHEDRKITWNYTTINTKKRRAQFYEDFESWYATADNEIYFMNQMDITKGTHLENIHKIMNEFFYDFKLALKLYCYHFKLSFKIYDPKDPQECKIYLSQCIGRSFGDARN